jgi:predicted cupin superfamily sugar epimerase
MGTTVAPGFDYTDYETAPRARLLATHPDAKDLILALTR